MSHTCIIGEQNEINRDVLDAVIAKSPVYLRPVLVAVRDATTGLLLINQGHEPFVTPTVCGRSTISMILDDTDRSVGPLGFHRRSLRRLIRASDAFAVISSSAIGLPYAAMSAVAATGKATVIIETRLEHELQWLALIQRVAPKRPLMLCTIEGGRA